jgi:hypothetical protein
MTHEQFIYWLKGFIDYQQLQEQRNPAFTRIKDELNKVSDISTIGTGNSTVTYKTDNPITYTTKQNSKATNSYI